MYYNPYKVRNKWNIYAKIWRIIVNEIVFNNIAMPVLNGCDLCAASEPFYHADRVTDFNILIYVLEGEIYVTEADTDYIIHEGELLFLKSGVHHFGKYEISKGTRWYFVHFYFKEEENLPVFTPDSSPIIQYEPVRFSAALPKKLTGLSGGEIERKITALCDYFHSSDNMKKWNINLRLSELLSSVAFYGITERKPFSLSDKICHYLNEHYNEPFSAKALEKQFFLSYKYMASVFRKEKGITMQQYHTEVRMNSAQSLLKSTFIPVGEISRSLGYADMLYFSRCFRQYTGVSPTEYRKKAPMVY